MVLFSLKILWNYSPVVAVRSSEDKILTYKKPSTDVTTCVILQRGHELHGLPWDLFTMNDFTPKSCEGEEKMRQRSMCASDRK